jgi:hypothetical protein
MATFFGGEELVEQKIILFDGSLTNIEQERLVYTVPTGFYARIRRCTLDWNINVTGHRLFHRANGVINSATPLTSYADEELVRASVNGTGLAAIDANPFWGMPEQIRLFQPFGSSFNYFLPEGDQIRHDYPTTLTGQVRYKIILDVYKAP